MKAILDTLFDAVVVRQRFAREARASARIVHPNVVGVFDLGEFDGGAYLVLEYLEGRTLRGALEREGPMLPADGSAARAKILDFGLAVARDHDFAEGSKLTRTGTTVGTLTYMSPEQFVGEPVDERTDVHALGIVVLEMLTGSVDLRGPFFSRAEAILTERLRGPDAPPAKRDLAVVLSRAIHGIKEERYRTIAEFRADVLPALSRCEGP